VHGHWVVCGFGRFGREVVHDLRAEGYDVTVVEPSAAAVEREPDAIVGLGEDPEVLAAAGIERAAGFVAGTDNDTTNLSLVAAARSANPDLFVAARQNKQASAPLFNAVDVDALLVPAEVVAHEVYASWRPRCSSGSSGRCPRAATSGPTASSASSRTSAASACSPSGGCS
jgi:Trk K+ transport system NAD-binding subunit